MALSTAIFVGEAKEWIPELVERAKKLKVNAGLFAYFLERTSQTFDLIQTYSAYTDSRCSV